MDKNITLEATFSANDPEVTLAGLTRERFMLQRLVETGVIHLEDWQALEEDARQNILAAETLEELLASLVEIGLLTEYQASRVLTGSAQQLVLGPYRILDRIGAGGMGIVYRGEHCLLRRPVAIKVLQ